MPIRMMHRTPVGAVGGYDGGERGGSVRDNSSAGPGSPASRLLQFCSACKPGLPQVLSERGGSVRDNSSAGPGSPASRLLQFCSACKPGLHQVLSERGGSVGDNSSAGS